nr:cytochrome c oxidase subunit II [Ptygomastax nihilsulcus]
MSTWSNLSFQDSNSPLMEQLSFFHDHTLTILIVIMLIVTYFMIYIMNKNLSYQYMLHGHMIETIWTVLPAMTLILIALPSIRMLYLIDENKMPMVTLKTIGRQWYWSYEYSDFYNVEFDSYMMPENELMNNMFRLLEVDNRTILPMNMLIRTLVTASDVIHSWAIPSLGVKTDATPGRLNQTSFIINRPGLYYGQCSEICGANHSFMPIVIESTSTNLFLKWINKMVN